MWRLPSLHYKCIFQSRDDRWSGADNHSYCCILGHTNRQHSLQRTNASPSILKSRPYLKANDKSWTNPNFRTQKLVNTKNISRISLCLQRISQLGGRKLNHKKQVILLFWGLLACADLCFGHYPINIPKMFDINLSFKISAEYFWPTSVSSLFSSKPRCSSFHMKIRSFTFTFPPSGSFRFSRSKYGYLHYK